MANRVTLSPEYFPNPTIGRPISNGYVYVGEIDLDPKIVGNQKQVSLLQEDGSEVEVSQPVSLSAGGTPTYNGSPVTILVEGSYSLRVDDKHGAQVYYVPKNAEATGDKTVETIADLRLISGDYANQGANVQGYYAVGDGGGGPRRYWNVDTYAPSDDDGGSIIVPTGVTTGAWLWEDGLTAVCADWFGAKGDGATDDSATITAAIASFLGYAGTVFFTAKLYRCNITLVSWITLKGVIGGNGINASQPQKQTRLKAYSAGVVIDSPISTTDKMFSASVRDMCIYGLGAGTAVIGLRIDYSARCEFRNIAFHDCSDQAVMATKGVANKWEFIFAQDCLLDLTRATRAGVFQTGDECHDNYFDSIETTTSQSSLYSVSMLNVAIYIQGSNHMFSGVIGEISDAGIVLDDAKNCKFVNCRADLNWGGGFVLTGSSSKNVFSGCISSRNGRETTNTYDSWSVEGTTSFNSFTNCLADSISGDSWVHRYGFYDNVNNQDRNRYIGCTSILHGTAESEMHYYLGSDFHVSKSNYLRITDSTTPSVEGISFLSLLNNAPTTVTDFTSGVPGQEITIRPTNNNTTIQHSSTLQTSTGQNETLVQDKLYKWRRMQDKWLPMYRTPANNYGTTAARPTLSTTDAGYPYWDSTVGKMIFWSGTAWVNSDGTAA